MRDFIPAEAKEPLIIFGYEVPAHRYVRFIILLPGHTVGMTRVEPTSVVGWGVPFRPHVIPVRYN